MTNPELNRFLPPIIGVISNSFIRGGTIESFINKNISWLRYLNAVLFGLTAYLVSFNVEFSVSMALGMCLGQSFGIPHNQTIRGNWTPMFFRGWVWAFILAIPMAYFCTWQALLYIPAALTMYFVYHGFDHFYIGKKQTRLFNQVTSAEMIYGLFLWSPLCFVHVIKTGWYLLAF